MSSLEYKSSAHYKGRAVLFAKADIHCMDNSAIDIEAVRERLREAFEKSGRSMSDVSVKAGAGRGYLSSILTEGKEPGILRLSALCKELDVSVAWVVYGYNITPATEKIMARLEDNPDRQEGILKLLAD